MYGKYLADISVVIYFRTSPPWNWIISIFRSPAIIEVWTSLICSNEFSRSDMKCLMLPLGCLYIPPMVRRWFRNFKAMNRLSNSHLLQLKDFFNSYSGPTLTVVSGWDIMISGTSMDQCTLKTENRHDANFVVTGDIAGCRNDTPRLVTSDEQVGFITTHAFCHDANFTACYDDNLRCPLWWQRWHHDDTRSSLERYTIPQISH